MTEHTSLYEKHYIRSAVSILQKSHCQDVLCHECPIQNGRCSATYMFITAHTAMLLNEYLAGCTDTDLMEAML